MTHVDYINILHLSPLPPLHFQCLKRKKNVYEIAKGDSRVKESLWKADAALSFPIPGAGMNAQH